ncbi:MAG: PEP-CTERM sorting domain-containing protein [Pirellulales bacterium]|nr:PEP-CTERM sorting domain-containing protein [Pirellulales bacterium]
MQNFLKLFTGTVLGWVLLANSASAGPLISEIYFNPPGGNDAPATNALEYIELCGDANLALDDYYLIFLENENDSLNSGAPGEIENIFDLSGMSFGSNGFLVLGMRNTAYPSINGAFDIATPAIASAPTKAESLKTLPNGAHAYINRDTGNGYGSGATSSIGHVGQNTDIEGSGFTAMLIQVNPLVGAAPVLNDDLDVDNDGLDVPTGQIGWTILDAIGVFGEAGESDYGRLYATNGFGPGTFAGGGIGGIESGATYIQTDSASPALLEIEYVGRVGMGNDPDDWFVANLTNDAASGFVTAQRNYAVSGNHTQQDTPEAWIGNTPGAVPYGTDVTVTFGFSNAVLHPVPEPSSFVLLGLGGAVLALVARRRRAG